MAIAAMVDRILRFADSSAVRMPVKVFLVPHEDPKEQERLTVAEAKKFKAQADADMSKAIGWVLAQPSPAGLMPTGVTFGGMLETLSVVAMAHEISTVEVEGAALLKPAGRVILAQ